MGATGWDDSEGPPPRPSGLPLWSKILIGCGAAVVLFLATCVGGAVFLVKKGGDLIQGQVRNEWADLGRTVEQLMSEEGTRALYARAPGLHARYASEEEFAVAAAGWRPHLETVPETMPILKGQIRLDENTDGDHRRVTLSFRNGKGARVHAIWRDGEMVDLDVEPEVPR